MRELKTEKDLLHYRFLNKNEDSFYLKIKMMIPSIEINRMSFHKMEYIPVNIGKVKVSVFGSIFKYGLFEKVFLMITSDEFLSTKVFELKWKEVKEFFDILNKEAHCLNGVLSEYKSLDISNNFKNIYHTDEFNKSEIDKIISIDNFEIFYYRKSNYGPSRESIYSTKKIDKFPSKLIIKPKFLIFNPEIFLTKREDDWFIVELNIKNKSGPFSIGTINLEYKIDGFENLYSILNKFSIKK